MKDFYIYQKGNKQVTVGGVKLLSDFGTEQITVTVANAQIIITGQKLEIGYFNVDEICVVGIIENIVTSKATRQKRKRSD